MMDSTEVVKAFGLALERLKEVLVESESALIVIYVIGWEGETVYGRFWTSPGRTEMVTQVSKKQNRSVRYLRVR